MTYFETGTQKDALTFAYDSLGRQTVTSRGGNAVTTAVYNVLSRVSSRTDHAISSTASTYGFDWRGQQLSATSPTYSGSTTFAWRFDGLIASRGWPTGTNSATFAYDRAKRPTTLTEKLSGVDQAIFTQAYDRSGTVTAEGRTLSGISGIAGTGSQSFTYDPLHRVTGSTISGGPSQTYTYDANSNRLSWNDGTATTTYDYNEADELTAQHRSGVDRTYSYDSYGNMTSSAVASSGATNYTYDAQDLVKSITPPSGGALSFTLDALGRHWTKSVGGTLADTYGYIGASEAVVRIDQAGGSVSAAIDAGGNRVATSTSAGGFGWLLPDLHGDVAGALSSSGAAISDAFRYSAYGTTLAKTTSSLPSPWRFQGRLALNSDDGTSANTDLYDFVARAYDPNLGAFTSLDTFAGAAQSPASLNRFLYALANPATLVDPDGHCASAWWCPWVTPILGQGVSSQLSDDLVGQAADAYDRMGLHGGAITLGFIDRGGEILDETVNGVVGFVVPQPARSREEQAGDVQAAIEQGRATKEWTDKLIRDPVGTVGGEVGQWWNRTATGLTSRRGYEQGRTLADVADVASYAIPIGGGVGRLALRGGLEIAGRLGVRTSIEGAIAESRWLPGAARWELEGAIQWRNVRPTGLLRDARGRFVSDPARPRLPSSVGRSGSQQRLRGLGVDTSQPSWIRGWIRNEIRQIEQGSRTTIRRPPGYDLAHWRGYEARDGYSYSHSNLQVRANHWIQNSVSQRQLFHRGMLEFEQ